MANGFSVRMPAWLSERERRLPSRTASEDELMRLLNELAAQDVEEGTGGPFAAAVFDSASGEILSIGVNLVLSAGLSFAHAEMVALTLAQRRLGQWRLNADGRRRTLMITAQPCAMCTGAIVWSGVARIDFGASGADVAALAGFDEGPVSPAWREELESRGIRVRSGRREAEARRVLADFGARVAAGGATLYNGGAGEG